MKFCSCSNHQKVSRQSGQSFHSQKLGPSVKWVLCLSVLDEFEDINLSTLLLVNIYGHNAFPQAYPGSSQSGLSENEQQTAYPLLTFTSIT